VIALTRRYAFPAAHVLRHPDFSEAENRRVYGKCANPGGHGHDYGIEVTLTGPVDERAGSVIEPDLLDAIFEEHIRSRFSHRLLNDDPLFQRRVPTAENLAEAIFAGLAEPVAERSTARVVGVRVVETRRNAFAYGDTAD
jgi:6-pyruvoyltetrahydropterin/6-carboxytetrahydropterin synthase